MFADIEGYSRLVDQGEERNYERITRSIELFRELISDYGGEVSNVAGDGILAVFDSASRAINFAVTFQNELKNAAVWNTKDDPIAFRIGISLGELKESEEGLYGHSVNVAARIQALAKPGGVCISELTKMAVHDWTALKLHTLGKQQLKNIEQPVEVFSVDVTDVENKPSVAVKLKPAVPPRLMRSDVKAASVAVLPFLNQTANASDEHFCEGLTDDVISSLCRFRDLIVIARRSVEPYRDRKTAPDKIGRDLGVRYLLDGEVQRNDSRLRARVRLTEAASGVAIWSERYDGEISDIFDFQDDITAQIASLLAIQITETERRRMLSSRQPDLRAYGLILRGQDLIAWYRQETNAHARRLFEQAIDLDPIYSRAYAAASRTFNLDWRYAWATDPAASLDHAVDLASLAIGFDEFDARGFGEQGYALLYKKQHEESLAAYERALQLNPNDADLLAEMGDALGYCRESERAVELLERAIRLNPYYPDWYLWYLGDVHFYAGDYRKVVATLNRMRDKSEARRLLTASHVLLGEEDEAKRQAAKLLEKHPNFSLEHWRDVPPNKFAEDNEIYVDALKRAGLK